MLVVLTLLCQLLLLPGGTSRVHAAPTDLLLIDNGDPLYAENPAWSNSSVKGYNGTTTRVTGGVGNYATWTPAAGTVQGTYKVSIFKVKRPTLTDDANGKIDVVHSGTTYTRFIDFTQGTSEWVELGTFTFSGAGDEFVKMTKMSTVNGTFIHADAVKFEKVAAGSDASLTGLQVNGGGAALSPAFSPQVTAYTTTVTPQTSSVSVTASVYDLAASVHVNGTAVASGVPSPSIPLAVGDTAIHVTVTAADGTTTRDYMITVTRPPQVDASLQSLVLSAGTLSPAFSPSVLSYTSEVELQTDRLRVTPTAVDPTAVIRVNGTVVPNGSESSDIPLVVGSNPIAITVTAATYGGGPSDEKSYSIQVTRKEFNTILVDFGDPGYMETGSWTTSNTVRGVDRSTTRYSAVTNSTITWKPSMTAGTAKVSFYKVNWPDGADPRVKLDIVHGGITDTKFIDLTPATEGWIDLGTYTFTGAGNEYVRLTRITTTPGYTRADAVKFEGTVQRKPPAEGALRTRTLPNLQYTEQGTIENGDYKVTFYKADWTGGTTVVRDVYYRENGVWTPMNSVPERLEEQWVLFGGSFGERSNYYDSMDYTWVLFDGFSMPDSQTVVLTDSRNSSQYDFSVTWSLAGPRPVISYAYTPKTSGNYVVGYQSFTTEDLADVSEVLSGARNHAKMAGTAESTGLWELTAPMSLVEKKNAAGNPVTYGLYIPSEQLPLTFEPDGTAGNQRLGMSLINNEGKVQPILYAPQFGTYSQLTAGSTYRFSVGLYAEPGAVYDAYTDILRNEYDYTAYRENVTGGSLTDAMFNMIDLVKVEPEGDDSVNFVPSLSGWWNRAKGFIDIENQDSIRSATSSVLMGAYYMTGDDQLYDTRALPMLEHGVSRNERGWSPTKSMVYTDSSLWKMAAVPFDVSTVSTFYEMTRGQNAGLYDLGLEEYQFRNPDQFVRGPVIQPLMTYRMTGDPKYLNEAKAAADQYIAQEIDTPATVDLGRTNFFYNYGKLWVEILELYEETKDPKYLNAAYKEAKRYASIFVARPVPDGSISIPQPSPPRYSLAFRWTDEYKYQYPRTKLPEDAPGGRVVDSWIVSPNGLTFEAGDTSANYRLNAQEAPFLLRIAEYTGDELLRDIAHNAVIGRYTNYPGYYYKSLISSQTEPDFPLLGPSEGTSIYYHHAPAQLGQTMDYLVTEQMTRSNGQISFPFAFESDFLWFKYHVYGSKPGTFYGNPNVWLWMPKGIVSTNNTQLNWITAESGNKFYISLANESKVQQQATVTLNPSIIGLDPNASYPVTIIADNGTPTQTVMQGGSIPVTVSARGITAIIVDGMNIHVPLHQTPTVKDTSEASYSFDTYSPIDAVKGMLLVKPDETSYNAYIQAKTTNPAALHYSLDGGATYTTLPDTIYPMEWSIRVNDLSTPFTYYVESEGKRTQGRTLYLPNHVTSIPSQPPQLPAPPMTIVDNVDAETEGSWMRSTTANEYYFDNYVTARPIAGEPTSRLRWRPALTENGNYNVYVKLPVGGISNATDAVFTVYYDGGSKAYTLNQKTTNGQWILLGKHPFAAGTSGYVEVTNRATGVVVADAVMWVNENVVPVLDSVTLTSDKAVLEKTKTVQLSVTGLLNTGVVGDLTGATIEYVVDRSDLVSVDAQGRMTLNGLDGVTDQVSVKARVTIGGTVLESKPILIGLRELTIIVDTFDTAHYSETGTWRLSSLTGYSKDVRSKYTEEQGATATWRPDIPAGKLAVSIYKIVRFPGPDTHVKVEVKHGGVTTVFDVDASAGESGWLPLGVFDFTGDGTEFVRMTRVSPSSTPELGVFTRADAVKFESYSFTGTLTSPVVLDAVPVDSGFELTFNHPVDPATVNSSTMAIKAEGAQAAVEAVLTVSPDGKKVTLQPAQALQYATNYQLTLASGFASAEGVALSPYVRTVYAVRTAEQPSTPVTGIAVSPSVLLFHSASSPQGLLASTVTPTDATDRSVVWSSSDPSVAAVDAAGRVTAVADGTAVITATTVDGGFTSSSNVTVDRTAPTVSAAIPAVLLQTESLAAEIGITDSLTGVASKEIRWDGQLVERLELPPLSQSLGEHQVTVTAVDGAGNQATVTYTVTVTLNLEHLDEAVTIGNANGWIDNEVLYSRLMNKIGQVQESPTSQTVLNGLNSLENAVRALKGKKLDDAFSDLLLTDIAFLKQAVIASE